MTTRYLIVGIFAAVILSSRVQADTILTTYIGAISTGETSPGGLTGNSAWESGSSVGWSVRGWDNDSDSTVDFWTYEYTFKVANDSKDISHFIVETSDSFTRSNIINGVYEGATLNDSDEFNTSGLIPYGDGSGQPNYEIKTLAENGLNWDPSDPSNPGLPAAIPGIKVNTPEGAVKEFTFWFASDRDPVWANVYAKDGKNGGNDVYLYNTELAGSLEDNPYYLAAPEFDSSGELPFTGFILAPDSTSGGGTGIEVPHPGSLAGVLSMAVMGLIGRLWWRRF